MRKTRKRSEKQQTNENVKIQRTGNILDWKVDAERMMKSVVFVAIAIVISGVFVATVDAVAGKFQLAVVIIKSQIEFSSFVCEPHKKFFFLNFVHDWLNKFSTSTRHVFGQSHTNCYY